MPDYGSGVRIFCDTLTWRQKTQRHAPKDLAEVRQRMPLPSQRTDSDDDNAMPSLAADVKSWETWAFAEKRAFRPAERLNAAGQLEEFVQITFGQWSVHGGSVDEYAWHVVSEGELKRRKAEAEQKAAEDETDPQPAAAAAQVRRSGWKTWCVFAGGCVKKKRNLIVRNN